MSSDPLPRADRGATGHGIRDFLFRRRTGQLLLVLVGLRVLGSFGLVPSFLLTVSTVGLWIFVAVFLLRGVTRLRAKLLWRIRRKLVISYLLIGLVPTVLILFFLVIGAYFMAGQTSSYMLNSTMQRIDAQAAGTADLMLSELRALGPSGRRVGDDTVRAVLESRLAPLRAVFPRAGAIYIEHLGGTVQRVVATPPLVGALAAGSRLPEWVASGYRGPLRLKETNFVGGISPLEESQSGSVLVLAPLESVLGHAAAENGFHIDQTLTSVSDEENAETVFVPESRTRADDARAASRPLTLPWLSLLQARNLDRLDSDENDLVFVQFGFAPMSLFESINANALQLGPEGPDLGQLILAALALLAGLFFLIEVSAIFVGLVLARSITGSVHALSQGTEHVRQGDFNYKVQVRSRDQLGELADSFNLMTTSIQDLLHQSAEKERLEEELRIARTIQMSLLPKDRVSVPGLSIAALCLPATEVGGDYYDFIPLEDGRLAILIADVSGKGTSAALYMAELKGLVLSLSQIYDSPRKLMVEANKILAANLDSRSFITMAYAVVDMGTRRMTYARAGHNPIFHLPLNGGGGRTEVLAPDGLGLALDRGKQFERILEEASIDLEPGDLFLFFTDGVSEAMNPHSELFGEERLRRVMENNADLPTEELRERLVDEVFSFAGGAMQHDDMTMVLVKVL